MLCDVIFFCHKKLKCYKEDYRATNQGTNSYHSLPQEPDTSDMRSEQYGSGFKSDRLYTYISERLNEPE